MRIIRLLRSLPVILLMFVLSSCLTPLQIPQAPLKKPIQVQGKASPVMLKKVMVKMPRGTLFGQLQRGAFCEPVKNLTWQSGKSNWDEEEFSEILREQFEQAHYQVVDTTESMFEDFSESLADYFLGALIKDMKFSSCCYGAERGDLSYGKGSAFIEVEWQVYSKRQRDVVLTVKTKGSVTGYNFKDSDFFEPVRRAFGNAAHNLLAEQKFYDLIVLAHDSPHAKDALDPITVQLKHEVTAPDAQPESAINRARLSVLTIYAGQFHGSGFIISTDGYVLTNQHVVGKAKSISAKTLTGREVLGEVIRIDQARDVALIKLEKDLYEPLPIGKSSDVQAGSAVYAIGSPFLDKLGQTVSKGIVSGFQTQDEHRFIQSDVMIHPGNSGGPLITTSGETIGIAARALLTPQGTGIGVNLFIPIEEALNALRIVEPK